MADKKHAFGRSLSDFPKLNDAEKTLVERAGKGEFAKFGDKIPETEAEKKTRTIRAGLVRFLALGGDDQTPVHEQGVQVRGAVIAGALDFAGCTLAGDLILWDSELTGTLTLRGARTRTVSLQGSRCRDIKADRAVIVGGLYLRNGFVAQGAVWLLGADINGPFDCRSGRFEGQDGNKNALVCDRIHVGGGVFLGKCVVTQGAVRLLIANIKGDIDCGGGRLEGQDETGNAILCDSIQVGGDVFLGDKFVAQGAVRLIGAQIEGDLACIDGTFGALPEEPPSKDGEKPSAAKGKDKLQPTAPPRPTHITLIAARAKVKGTLWLAGPGPTAQFHGGVDFTGAHVGRIVDAVTETTERRKPDATPAGAGVSPAFLMLDGLTYDRFGEDTDLSAKARIAFLRVQQDDDLKEGFKPQPWTQMVKALREAGHIDAAREVAIEFEEQRRRAGKVSGFASPLHRLYGLLVGYGHRPMKLVAIMLFVWSISAILFQLAAEAGWFAPTDPHYFQDERYKNCRPENGGNWIACVDIAPEYSRFNVLAYSLDVLLPLVDLQQEREWAPIIAKGPAKPGDPATPINGGVLARLLMWFEVLFGWLSSALLAAVLTGLAKRVD